MSPLRSLRQLILPGPTGRHRLLQVHGPERIEVPLDDLFGPPLPQPRFVDVTHGAIAPQAFRHCPPCGGDVPVVLHAGGARTCDTGHLTLPTTALGDS